MGLLIRSVTLLDQQSPFHRQVIDLRWESGIITQLGPSLPMAGDDVFDASGCYLSAGWIDLMAFVSEPAGSSPEKLNSLQEAAAAGGFTGVLAFSEGQPAADSRMAIGYLVAQASGRLTDCWIAGTLSRGREGKELADLYEMHAAGARAFGDAPVPLTSAGLMFRALSYAKHLQAAIVSFPHEPSLSPGGQVHEGRTSVLLGLQGIPAVAEELMVARDLMLAAYAGRPLHLGCITTAGSVALLRHARQQGISVTAAVPATHLLYDEERLHHYNTCWKLFPPLRTASDAVALRQGLADGTIDAVCSLHRPCSHDDKLAPFDEAAFGMINLQTCFSQLYASCRHLLSLEQIIDKLAVAPRKILNLPMPQFSPGAPANFTIFDPERQWTFLPEMNRSAAANTPLFGHTFTGKPVAVANNKQFQFIH
ncbi:MAG: dihydroorotase [Chitinophagales bacterium]|nr:dihydroorotase [Chitinophagales bacterium]MDW8394258.1 dihydroorotase [Chitinophagales bacterium]